MMTWLSLREKNSAAAVPAAAGKIHFQPTTVFKKKKKKSYKYTACFLALCEKRKIDRGIESEREWHVLSQTRGGKVCVWGVFTIEEGVIRNHVWGC